MPEQDEEPKKKGGLVKILLFVIIGILLVGIGLGVGFVLFGKAKSDPSAEVGAIIERKAEEEAAAAAAAAAEAAEPKKVVQEMPTAEKFLTIYYEFPGTFTTNLNGSRRFLQVGLGVSTQYDEQVMANVDAHQLALRSDILGIISDFSEADVAGKSGRDALAGALKTGINARLEELEGFGGVEDVYFTSFVLQ